MLCFHSARIAFPLRLGRHVIADGEHYSLEHETLDAAWRQPLRSTADDRTCGSHLIFRSRHVRGMCVLAPGP